MAAQFQLMSDIDPMVAWRWLSGIRALAALFSWLLLALSPNNNFLLRQILDPVRWTFLPFTEF